MARQDFYELTRAQPFRPFRVYSSDGRTYEVRHPDQVLVLETSGLLAVPRADGSGIGSERLSLLRVVRLEDLAVQRSA